jgi:hypothetical protein
LYINQIILLDRNATIHQNANTSGEFWGNTQIWWTFTGVRNVFTVYLNAVIMSKTIENNFQQNCALGKILKNYVYLEEFLFVGLKLNFNM